MKITTEEIAWILDPEAMTTTVACGKQTPGVIQHRVIEANELAIALQNLLVTKLRENNASHNRTVMRDKAGYELEIITNTVKCHWCDNDATGTARITGMFSAPSCGSIGHGVDYA